MANNPAQSPAKATGRFFESAWVAAGGALGTLARHGMDLLLAPAPLWPAGFPWPTLLVNLSGAALLGFIMAWVEEGHPPAWLRPAAAIGFCGAYTTFSTASVEILLLARDGHTALVLSYLAGSVVGGLLAVTAATALAVRMFRPASATSNLPS